MRYIDRVEDRMEGDRLRRFSVVKCELCGKETLHRKHVLRVLDKPCTCQHFKKPRGGLLRPLCLKPHWKVSLSTSV